jgi:hypothetical protein
MHSKLAVLHGTASWGMRYCSTSLKTPSFTVRAQRAPAGRRIPSTWRRLLWGPFASAASYGTQLVVWYTDRVEAVTDVFSICNSTYFNGTPMSPDGELALECGLDNEVVVKYRKEKAVQRESCCCGRDLADLFALCFSPPPLPPPPPPNAVMQKAYQDERAASGTTASPLP